VIFRVLVYFFAAPFEGVIVNRTEHVPFANPLIDVPTTLQVFGVVAVIETLPPLGTVNEYFFKSEVLLTSFPRANSGVLDPEVATGATGGTVVVTEGTVVVVVVVDVVVVDPD
jgi:hypothetical protein